MNTNRTYKYEFTLKGDTIREILDEALHFVYALLNRSLHQQRLQGIDHEYEVFALWLLTFLQKYRAIYTTLPDAPSPPADY